MVCPKNTNPKKNGITPSRKTRRLLQDLDKVADIKLRLGLYYRYLRIVTQASITPNPINNSLCSKIAKFYYITSYSKETSAPKI